MYRTVEWMDAQVKSNDNKEGKKEEQVTYRQTDSKLR